MSKPLTLVSGLSPNTVKVMRALLRCWLEDTDVGIDLRNRSGLNIEKSIDCLLDLRQAGLVEFLWDEKREAFTVKLNSEVRAAI